MEWLGSFQVPGSSRKVGGRLVIDERASELTTFDALLDESNRQAAFPTSDVVLPMVWGEAQDGQRLSLLNVRALGGTLYLGDWASERWLVDAAIEERLEPEPSVTFSALSFTLTYLSSWLEAPAPAVEWEGDVVRFESTRTPLWKVGCGDLGFEFTSIWGTESGFDKQTIEFPTIATATSVVDLELEKLTNATVVPIEALLWVATGRFSEMAIRVRLDGSPPIYAKVWASLLKPLTHADPKRRIHKSDMLFTAAELPEGFDSGLRQWIDRWNTLQPSIGPVIARYRAPFAYVDDRFATSVAALESYSTIVRHGPFEIPKKERKKRIAKVEQALQSDAPELVGWVRSALRNADRFELNTRLSLLLDESGQVSESLVGAEGEVFVERVIKSRNQVAHSLVRRGGIEGGGSLHWAFRGLNWLLRYYAMIELGFSEQFAQERITQNGEFRQEAARLRTSLVRADDEHATS